MAIETQLGSKEKGMHRALTNDPNPQAMRKWNYNKTQFLIGRKTTNGMSGETKIEFEKVPRPKDEATKTRKEIVLDQLINSKSDIKKEINQLNGLIHAKTLIIELSTEAIEQAKAKNIGLRTALEILQKNSK